MYPKPAAQLTPNTYEYESRPMVKATGFREYDARWLFEKEINLMGVQALGMGLGTLICEMGIKPEIVTAHDLSPEDIASVTARVHQGAIDVLGPVVNPQTVHQGKFSMGTVLGLIAAFRNAGLTEFEEHYNAPRIAASVGRSKARAM